VSAEILWAIWKKKRICKTVRNGQITDEYRRMEKNVKNIIWMGRDKQEVLPYLC
jgi:hypothetical protein